MNQYIIDIEPSNNKNCILGLITQIVWNDFNLPNDLDNLLFIKNCNLYQLEFFYENWIKELSSRNYKVHKFIKKSIKLSYGGNRLIGLSSIEKNRFLTDLRNCFIENIPNS